MKYYKVHLLKGYVATIEANSKAEAVKITNELKRQLTEDEVKSLSYVKKI